MVVLTQDQQALVYGFNDREDATILDHCVHDLFEKAVARFKMHTALICGSESLKYEHLNIRVNRVARVLRNRGLGPGDIVCLILDRSLELVVAILAILKAGAAYVPIDSSFPASRVSHMLDDADPKLVIVHSHDVKTVVLGREDICLSIEEVEEEARRLKLKDDNFELRRNSQSLAYMIYTSGSTGKPKGVKICHGALCNLLLSMRRQPGCTESDRVLAVTTICFDIAVAEIILPLLCGATVVMAQKDQVKDSGLLLDLMRANRVTMMQGTPATWQMLLDSGWEGQPRLKKILCGGDKLSRQLADRLISCSDSVWNMYGPTETTVWASSWKVCLGEDVSIGQPIANCRLYVLGSNLNPVPLGTSGELYIGGAGVAQGYHQKSDLTRSRFLKNPFHADTMYKTGDIARFTSIDKLLLQGREDNQVKVRGHRIELGDVEAIMTAHEGISQAVVVCRDDRLMAYYIPMPTVNKSSKSQTTQGPRDMKTHLHKWLMRHLPTYMVPSMYTELRVFPMTPNGKVDRKILPTIFGDSHTESVAGNVTHLERCVVQTWASVLGHNHFDVHDNFFQVGGDSARIVRVKAELEKRLGRPILLAKLFENFTAKALAAYLATLDEPRLTQSFDSGDRHAEAGTEDVAIISMACRLPGGVTTPDEFWSLLKNGIDAIDDIPKTRWDADALYHPDPGRPGKSYCRQGGFLKSIDSYDIALLGISPLEAQAMDPKQLLMLETCWEGFERAGYTLEGLRGSETGVFIGVSDVAAHRSLEAHISDRNGYTMTGSASSIISGRVSHTLGLEGPALTVDTACSSSLVATHLACNALRQRECNVAVAGGISLLLTPEMYLEFSRLQGMSHDGRCRAFDAHSDGTGWAEGSVVVVLKRLPDALRDQDIIHAVIRSSVVNHDGRSASLTAPRGLAQQRLLHTALKKSGLRPTDIDYIEAHGTGTQLGDPIEGTALAEVFGGDNSRAEPLYLGSAKSNIGHTQAAAGLVGLLKVVLAMRHKQIARTLHVVEPNPEIDWVGAKMMPVLESRPWLPSATRKRRAGISAFGISGTNAHVIVEEAPASAKLKRPEVVLPPTLPFMLSSHTKAALDGQVEKLRKHVNAMTDCNQVRDLAFSLATTRTHFQHRLVSTAADLESLLMKLTPACLQALKPAGVHQKGAIVAMLFTGQGSQLLGMGRDLCQSFPIFKRSLQHVANCFTELEKPLLDVMWADPSSPDAALLHRTDFTQPALFALEVSLWRLWQSWGVKPNFVLGHSIGELAAAYASGVIGLPDACRLVTARGRLIQSVPIAGKMLSIEADPTETVARLEELGVKGKVDLAGHNTASQTVISGDTDAIDTVAAHFRGRGRKVKYLRVSHAFHSHHMDGILAAFRAVAETIEFCPPKVAIVSSLTGKLAEHGELERSEYWVDQLRREVRFSDGVRTLLDLGVAAFVELGPQPILSMLGQTCLTVEDRKKPHIWLPSLRPKLDSASVIQNSLIELHKYHIPIDWSAYFLDFGCRRVDLPTYAFQRACHSFGVSAQRRSINPEHGPGGNLSPHSRELVATTKTEVGCQETSPPANKPNWRDTLFRASSEERTVALQGIIREIIIDITELASVEDDVMDLSLQDIGIDSVTGILLRSRLEALFRPDFPMRIPLACSSLRAIIQYLLLQIQKYTQETTDAPPVDTIASAGKIGIAFDQYAAPTREGLMKADHTCQHSQQYASRADPGGSQRNLLRESPPRLTQYSRTVCPSLGLRPPGTNVGLFKSTLDFFDEIPWCSRIMHSTSPSSDTLPGHGQPVAFIPQCFNPANERHEQFIGYTLSSGHSPVSTHLSSTKLHVVNSDQRQPAIRHILSLFRPCDDSHMRNALRPISQVATLFCVGNCTSGYEGILHGGFITTLIDESLGIVKEINAALGKAGDLSNKQSVTASLDIRFLAPIATTEEVLCVVAWIERLEGATTIMKGEVRNAKGERLATADSTWITISS